MGVDLLLNVIAFPVDREPDWAAAERQIDGLEFRHLQGYFEYSDPDWEWLDEAAEDANFLAQVREELREHLRDLELALSKRRSDTASFAFGGFVFHATGGLSAGDVPTELYDSVSLLEAVGALHVAGFAPAYVDTGSSIDDGWVDSPQFAGHLKFKRLALGGRACGPEDSLEFRVRNSEPNWHTKFIRHAVDHLLATGCRNDAATFACDDSWVRIVVDPEVLVLYAAVDLEAQRTGESSEEQRQSLRLLGWREREKDPAQKEMERFVQEWSLRDEDVATNVASIVAMTLSDVYGAPPDTELHVQISYLGGADS